MDCVIGWSGSVSKFPNKIINLFLFRYNEIFKVALLVSNFVGAGSLCFYLFMLSESSDVLIIAQYIIPTMVLVGFTFEICFRGTQLEVAVSLSWV